MVKDWRAKVVGYRDLDYTDVPAMVDNPFVGSVHELEAQLDALTADGGGDEPETLLEALYMLANMPATAADESLRSDAWRPVSAGRRFVIVFTDAPFKEPLRAPEGRDASTTVILNLMTAKIVLHMFAPATPRRFGTLEEVDKALWYKIPVNAGENAQKALEEYTADQSKFEKIIQLLAKTMTQQSSEDTRCRLVLVLVFHCSIESQHDTDRHQHSTKGVVDVVFCLDASGSMAPCIDAVRKNLDAFLEALARRHRTARSTAGSTSSRIPAAKTAIWSARRSLQQERDRSDQALYGQRPNPAAFFTTDRDAIRRGLQERGRLRRRGDADRAGHGPRFPLAARRPGAIASW